MKTNKSIWAMGGMIAAGHGLVRMQCGSVFILFFL